MKLCVVTKTTDKGGVVVNISTSHVQSMVMQHLLDDNIYKKLASCINNKIQSNLLRFISQHKTCFAESEGKFLNDKHHKVTHFYGLAKIHKFMII